MNPADMLMRALGGSLAKAVADAYDQLAEIRLRVDRPARLITIDGREIACETMDARQIASILGKLMNHSMYACEHELREGYFTAAGGMRVGVCGKTAMVDGCIRSLSGIGSACIRIPREVRGCGDDLARRMSRDGLKSLLVLSPPGMGKTTLLRDIARILSEDGRNVAIADERREIAACLEGSPQLDVGPRTDVLDGCPKAKAIVMLLRSCAPDVIIADEIGSPEDAAALFEAAQCGVAIAASAHAPSLAEALRRTETGALMREGIFDLCAVIGGGRGRIKEIHDMRAAQG